MAVTIKVRQNGSYLVDGEEVTLVDWNGNAYEIAKRPFALCRCGASTRKPFCDGTHSRIGFQAAEAAVPGSADRPATGATTATPAGPASSDKPVG
jgi:3-phenylpropionate/trans-cinnamate dioxygenase ferredoxin subunit